MRHRLVIGRRTLNDAETVALERTIQVSVSGFLDTFDVDDGGWRASRKECNRGLCRREGLLLGRGTIRNGCVRGSDYQIPGRQRGGGDEGSGIIRGRGGAVKRSEVGVLVVDVHILVDITMGDLDGVKGRGGVRSARVTAFPGFSTSATSDVDQLHVGREKGHVMIQTVSPRGDQIPNLVGILEDHLQGPGLLCVEDTHSE